MRHLVAVAAILAILAPAMASAACNNGGRSATTVAPASATPGAPGAVSPAPDQRAPPDFRVGTEFALPGLSQAYGGAGFRHARAVIEYGVWGNIEPEPGRYHWGPLDDLVSEYEAAGYQSLEVVLSAESPWASTSLALASRDFFPRPEYVDDYVRFISATVERYDADGLDDAPGLVHGVHRWGIERDVTGYWPGSAEDYVRLLRLAYPAVKNADPQSQVLLAGLVVTDAFDDGPNQAEGLQRLRADISSRKPLGDIQAILAACDAYDIVDFHSLGDYVEITATAAWLRDELRAAGCRDKEIIAGDALPMSVLIAYDARPFYPATDDTRDAARALLLAAANGEDPEHAESVGWLRAETAKGAVRKIVVSAAAGLSGINIASQEDWKTGLSTADSLAVNGAGSSIFAGLLDTRTEAAAPAGELHYTGGPLSRTRTALSERPAFAAVRLTLARLDGFTDVQRVEAGPGAWIYRFSTPRGVVWVAWYDEGELVLPGEPGPIQDVQIEINAPYATVTSIPTAGTAPAITTLDTNGGVLSLALGATPVFIGQR